MAAPFYNQADQDIYASGDKFIPQEQYRLGYTAPPSIANASTGITNTGAAQTYRYPYPYIWPPQGEGGGGGNEIEEDTFSMGMSPGALGGKLPGFGNWAKRTAGTVGDIYSQLPTPTNLLRKGWRGIQKWKKDRDIRKAEEKADEIGTITTTDIQKERSGDGSIWTPPGVSATEGSGGQTQGQKDTEAAQKDDPGLGGHAQGGRIGYGLGDIVKGWFSGGPESETNPTMFGTQNSLMNKTAINNLENAIGLYETQIENADQLGQLSEEDMLKYELAKKQLAALIAGSKGQAQGGRIGLYAGGDPEEPSENIFEFMQDQDIPYSEQVEGEEGILEQLVAKYIEAGFPPDQAEEMALQEFEQMSQGPEQDQGIASLV